jgi:hypothetical protein
MLMIAELCVKVRKGFGTEFARMKLQAVADAFGQTVGPPDSTLERSLRREVLLSERQRVLRLAGVLSGVLAVIILLRNIAPGVIETLFHGRISFGVPLAIFLSLSSPTS